MRRVHPGWLVAAAVVIVIALGATARAADRGAPAAGPAAEAGWLSRVQADLRASEYEVTWQDRTPLPGEAAAWQAPNRAHGFRVMFTEAGIHLVPRDAEAERWDFSLALAGYGRGGRVWAVEPARPSPSQARVDYRRGGLVEWYENGPKGLEQGFVLPAAPEEVAAWGGKEPLPGRTAVPGRGGEIEPRHLVHLDLAMGGGLRPEFAADGQAVDLLLGSGARVLRLSDLVVEDAGGRPVRAWMEGYVDIGGRGLRIVIDDRDAAYPLRVDPLATNPAWTAESDQVASRFGASASTAGDVNGDGYTDVLVGASSYDNGQADEGRAFVYLGSASGLATSPAWTAESDQVSAAFAYAVSTAGDVNGDGYADVLVGASSYDNGQIDEGRAYVYLGSASGLSASPAWTAEGDQAGTEYGSSVSTAGDINGDGYGDVIVGAFAYDNGQTDEGRAFVYLGSASGLATSPAWTAESDQASARFGGSVSTAGDVNGDGYGDVTVGAYWYDNGQTDEGRAYVYLGSASGLAASPAWTAESDQAGARFGLSVSTAGDVNGDGYADVIVGADQYGNGQAGEGRAFVYLGSASGLAASPAWTAESDQISAAFACAVSAAGDVNGDGYADVLVGAYRYDNGQTDEGRAFVYLGSPSGLAASPGWTAESDQAGAFFGSYVSTAGDVNGDGYSDVIAGAYLYDNGQTDEGRAFVYLGSASSLAPSPAWAPESNQASAFLGASAATAGDVNGDGYADVIVGAYYYDNGQGNEGQAYVYLGSASGLSTSAAWTAESDQINAYFGASVSTAGDVNGDGYSDVIVGAYSYDNGQADEGRAYVYLGSASGLAASPSWTAEGDQASAYFGQSVSTAGDVNGDGYSDVIAGAYQYDNGQADEGRAYVYLGSASGLAASPAWSAESDQAVALFGGAVSTAGDVNGDGYADVIVGARYYDNGQADEGRAYVYLGSASGLAASPAWMSESDQVNASFGASVSTAGDVNGDGYADVIVGSAWYDNGQTDEGGASVYLGSASGLSLFPAWAAESDQASAYFGVSVSTAGDVNGDGYADVVIGATGYDNGQTDEGRAFVYLGSASGLASSPAWTAESDQASAFFGSSVSAAGDVSGDGYADVIAGARSYDNGQVDEGRAFLYYGNGGSSFSLRPQQRRADNSGPIASGGASRSPGAFRLAAAGRSPFGRSDVKLEWELKLQGVSFDGRGTSVGTSWLDTGTGGVSVNQPLNGLEPGGYHWRLRFRYHPATSPFQQTSRWFTLPQGGWNEMDLSLRPFIGGVVWEDADGDGTRGAGETPLAHLRVYLLDQGGAVLTSTFTDSAGAYRFEVTADRTHRVRYTVPSGYMVTLQDQGFDDTLDSDADPYTGETTAIAPPYQAFDVSGWSAGLVREGPCFAPDEPIYVYGVRLGLNNYTILDFQDGNQAQQVTGYNVYRSSNPALPHGSWSLLASDVKDMDAGTANLQWVDTTGQSPPLGGAWYYEVAAYNAACDAEGPW